MGSTAYGSGTRREYRLSGWMRGLYLVLGLIVAGMGATAAFAVMANRTDAGVAPLMVIPLAIGGYLVLLAVRSRLVIDGSRIEVRGAFAENSADLSEIEGYRTIRTRNGSYWRIQRKDGRGSFNIQNSFAGDDNLRAWFQQMTNLDERDRTALLNEISQNAELGATPEDRLAALNRARQWNIGLSVGSIAAALGLNFASENLQLPLAVVLAVAPLVALMMIYRQPLLYALGKPKRDPRTDLAAVFLAAGLGMIFRNRSIEFFYEQPFWTAVLLLSLLYAALLYKPIRCSGSSNSPLFVGLIFAGMLGYALVTAADTLADTSKASNFTVQVIGKHLSRGRSTTYYLDLAPWGPVEGSSKIHVPRSVYEASGEGDSVCLALHTGRLSLPWYQRVDCRSEPEPGLAP